MADVKRGPGGSLDDDTGENFARLAAIAPRLSDIAVAIHAGSITRVEGAKALLEVVDPATLTGELVIEVLLAVDAYAENSAMRQSMTFDKTRRLLAIVYETMGLQDFAEYMDWVASQKANHEELD